MQHRIFYITGVSGSGKTSIGQRLATHLGIPYADGDDFHPPANIAKMKAGIPLQDADRADWLSAIHTFAREQLKNSSVVVSCSALKQAYRDRLSAGIPPGTIQWIHLYGDFNLILQRLSARKGHFMPPALLQSQFDIYEKPQEGWLLNVVQSPDQILAQIITTMSNQKQFGIIGLGVMGRNLARNFARNGVTLSLFNRFVAGKEEQVAAKAVAEHPELAQASAFESLPDFVQSLALPRKIFLMVNAGAAVEEVLAQLQPLLSPGDIVMDGGNSHYPDTERRQKKVEAQGVYFLGVGVSGGELGALQGPAIMVGGAEEASRAVTPFLEKIAAHDLTGGACAAYIGPGGAGHFVKMAHNGIEYAEMQLLAEVYSALRWEMGCSPDRVADILSDWASEGLRSYLLEITVDILRHREGEGWLLDMISDKAAHKGTGSWASIAASELGVPLTMMTEALFARFVAARRDERQKLSGSYAGAPPPHISLEWNDLKDAYQLARIMNHHQGFQLIQAASQRYQWQVNMPQLARIWTNGCIIRSELMQAATTYLTETGDLMQNQDVTEWIRNHKISLQKTVGALSFSHLAYPCLMAALAALNGSTTAVSAAHLIQAQRDYFGAHMYERTDDPSGHLYHTQWSH